MTDPVLVVRLFARARDLAGGADSLSLRPPLPATVGELRARLASECPALAPLLERSAVAVNQEFAEDSQELHAGDEVALIPPVSGGERSPRARG